MFTTIIAFATIPAEFITRIFDNKLFTGAVMYILRLVVMALIVIPIFTDLPFADTVGYIIGEPFAFVFGTIPFTTYDWAVATFGKGIAPLMTVLGILYWLIIAVALVVAMFKMHEHYSEPPREKYRHDSELSPTELAERKRYERESAKDWDDFFAGKQDHLFKNVDLVDPNRKPRFMDGNFETDANDDYLIHGLTTLREVQQAEVQANAIAKALRNR